MPDFPDIYVARHGQTEWNLAGRMQGALDSPLTELGRKQASDLGKIIRAHKLDELQVYCSPQGRARATLDLAFEHLPAAAKFDDRLVEIDLGPWCGKTREEVETLHGRPLAPFEIYHFSPGESLSDVALRTGRFLKELHHPALIICHGVTSRILRCQAMGLDWRKYLKIQGGQGQIHCVIAGQHSSLTIV